MKRIFSLAYLTLPNTHPVDQIHIASQCGYDGVGLRTISQNLPGEPNYALANGSVFHEVRTALESTGVKLMDIELARVTDGVDVASYEKEFALGAELGAGYATASVWTQNKDFALKQFEAMANLADKYGMKLALEFVPFSAVRNLKESIELMDAVGCPNVQVLVDLLHAHRTGLTGEQIKSVPASRFGPMHLCDGPALIPPVDHPDMTGVAREARLQLGEGAISAAEMIAALENAPYYGIELPNRVRTENIGKLGHAKRCIEATKIYFAKQGF